MVFTGVDSDWSPISGETGGWAVNASRTCQYPDSPAWFQPGRGAYENKTNESVKNFYS